MDYFYFTPLFQIYYSLRWLCFKHQKFQNNQQNHLFIATAINNEFYPNIKGYS